MKNLYTYLAVINLITALICVYDKVMAIKQKRRISEKTLILLSLFGGSVGMYVAMQTVRHKTKKKKFSIGIPLIILLQVAVYCCINKFF